MIRNYFKTAFRNFARYKLYSAINVLGLALGISSCLIIFLLVKFELSYDSIHSKKENIYRVTGQFQRADHISYQSHTPFPMAEALRNDFPELPFVTQTYHNFRGYLMTPEREKFVIDPVLFADHEFLNVFDFEMIEGNRQTALAEPNTVVLTRSVSEKIFGDRSPIGKILRFNNQLNLQITGVLADPPKNIHHNFEVLVSYLSFTNDYYELDVDLNNWDHNDMGTTYVVLPTGYKTDDFNDRINEFAIKYHGERFPEYGKYEIQSLADIHFDTRFAGSNMGKTTDKTTIIGFAVIGLVLLIAACINFINLSTAQSIRRSKEVGVRKAMGAFRGQLVYQFLGETFIISFISAVFSVMLVETLLPIANNLIGIELSLNLTSDGSTSGFLIFLVLMVTLMGGIYPALVLSRYRPVQVLRSDIKSLGNSGLSLRKFLVIVQFLIAQVLIISTIVTYNQVEYFRTKSLGFEPELVINFGTGILDSAKKDLLKNKLLQNNSIRHVSWFSSSPTNNGHLYGPLRLADRKDQQGLRTTHRAIDEHYIETFGLELIAGTDIDDEINKAVPGILVNETLLKTVGIEDPSSAIGEKIEGNWLIERSTIVGVIRDFHNQSLHREIIPVIFFHNPDFQWRAAVKIDHDNVKGLVRYLEDTFYGMFPDGILIYQFEDQRLADFYKEENRAFDAFQVFAVIAIIICCLGLFGLVSFVANQKVKEVGIRKVLGASVRHILVLFSRQFMAPLLAAFVIAVPIGYSLMNDWLDDFAYRINIGVGVFVLTLLASCMVTGITVGYYSMKAAAANPVDSLRYE